MPIKKLSMEITTVYANMQSKYKEKYIYFLLFRSVLSQSYVILPEMTHDCLLKVLEFWVELCNILQS